jgi:hypothetical protein
MLQNSLMKSFLSLEEKSIFLKEAAILLCLFFLISIVSYTLGVIKDRRKN